MKKLSGLSAIIIILILLILSLGCSNDVDLYVDGEAIPIVYCLLNPLEQTQYIRVGKSFIRFEDQLDSGVPADSLIWPVDAEVYIERWENDSPIESIVFDHITEVEKDSGLFPVEGLMIYQADFEPNPEEEYHLYVYFPELDKIVSGKTVVMKVPDVLDPENVPGRTVSFDTISPYNIRWKGGDHAGLYQGIFRMNYSESLDEDFNLKSCFFRTPLYYKQVAEDIYEEKINGLNFLQSVAKQISPLPGASRDLINFEFFFYATGPELAILVGSEIGISNPFTLIRNTSNIAGGMGVFSSLTYQRFPNLEPSVITKYFLATSEYTKHLGFNPD